MITKIQGWILSESNHLEKKNVGKLRLFLTIALLPLSMAFLTALYFRAFDLACLVAWFITFTSYFIKFTSRYRWHFYVSLLAAFLLSIAWLM